MSVTTPASTTIEPGSAAGFSASVCGFSAAVGPDGHVYLSGELDVTGLDALRAALEEALSESGELLLVDVGALSFIDSSAISELLKYQLVAASRERRLCLDAVSDQVAKVLEILDLRHLLMDTGHGLAGTAGTVGIER